MSGRLIFWNVDTQYDFMRDDESHRGKLSVPGARTIEPALERLTSFARKNGLRIVHTGDWHTPESPEISDTPDFKRTFPPHCLQRTRGAEHVPAAAPLKPFVIDWQDRSFDTAALARHQGEILIYKDEFDAFHPRGGPHTDRVLEVLQPESAVVYGVATNVCVNCAVLGLRKRGVNVTVATDAIKELPGLPLEPILEGWRKAGAFLSTTDEVATK
jgi:nicotinamidase/pyrazinamidase